MANKFKQKFKDNSSAIENLINGFSKTRRSIETMTERVKRQGKDVSKRIDTFYDDLLEKLLEQKQQLIQQVRDVIAGKEKALKLQLDETEQTLTQLALIKEMNGFMKDSNNDQEILLIKQKIDDGIQKLSDCHKCLNSQLMEVDSVQFFPCKSLSFPQFGEVLLNVDPLCSTVSDLQQYVFKGVKVDFRISAKYSNGHNYPRGGNRVTVALQSSTGGKAAIKVRDCNDGDYETSFVPQEVGNLKVFVSIDGQSIRDSPYHVFVSRNYPSIERPTLKVDCHGKMGIVWGIAFGHQNGVWAVADQSNHCVYVFLDDDKFLWKFGSKGSNKGQLDSPCGIAFDSNNCLYVADFNNCRVQKFDINGNYLLHYGNETSSEKILGSPAGVATHDSKVYVADSTLNCVVKFTNNGEFCQTIGKGLLHNPYGVIVTKENCLLVTDCKYNFIYSFSLDGHCLGKFVENRLSGPRNLTVDEDGFVFVTDTGNHRIVIYNKDGTYIHHFGSKGNFKILNPRGVGIHPNGNIYVCDSVNRCIKIYMC